MTTKIDLHKPSWTAKEILETEMPDVPYVVEGLLPQGLFWLAGKKKIGKSYLILQLMIAVASKNDLFLGRKVRHGKVLYISFEDNPRRIKKRLQAMKAASGLENLEIEFEYPPLNKGGFDKLKMRLKSKNYVLCVLDTWSWAFELRDSNKQDEAMKYLKPLHNITKEGKVCIGFVDHHHKASQYSGDQIDDISGTGAKGGIADTVWALYRTRGQRECTLDISSKDVLDDVKDMKITSIDGIWSEVNEHSVKPNTIQAGILEYMQASEEDNFISSIAQVLGKDKSVISREMSEMAAKGIIKSGNKIGKKIPFYLNNGHSKKQ